MSSDQRTAIGKAWPVFFFIVFNSDKSNKLIINYPELHERLNESINTIKKWKEHLVDHNVVDVIQGRTSMTFTLLPPFDSLVTCEQDDIAQIRMKSDPATRRILEKLSVYGNMSLLPIVAELYLKIDNLEKKLG